MGLNPASLDPKLRKRLGISLHGGHARAQLGCPGIGWVWLWLAGDPPRTTHHSKSIGIRTAKGGKKHPTLVDDPELERARDWYLERIPDRGRLPRPLCGPVLACLEFYFEVPEGPLPHPFFCEKPDWDNAAKLLMDVMAFRGWLVDDKHVAAGMVIKRVSTTLTGGPGVRVRLRTLLDDDNLLPLPIVDREGSPVPTSGVLHAFDNAARIQCTAFDRPKRRSEGSRAKRVTLPPIDPARQPAKRKT